MTHRVVTCVALLALACSSERATFAGKDESMGGDSLAEDAGNPATTAPSASEGIGGTGGSEPMPSATSDSTSASGSANGAGGTNGIGGAVDQGAAGDRSAATTTAEVEPPPAQTETSPETSTPATTPEVTASAPSTDEEVPPSTDEGGANEPTDPADPMCDAECCVDSDCGDGFECVDSVCACEAGSKECDGACIAETQCCTDDDCGASSHCEAGACECDDGSHQCGEECVSNDSTDSCGGACEPCPVPMGGEAVCDGTQCSAACPGSQKLCAGACIAAADPCDANCPAGSHDCGGVCQQVTSPLACGDSCVACPVPAHATATCDGEECDFECTSAYMRCDDECVPATGCCDDADCDADRTCDGANTCVCADGTMECDGTCIPTSGCCDDGDCGAGLGCEENECVDVGPPQVSTITPNSSATGVLSNAAIKITFTEPMEQASVQSALSISTLSTSSYTLAWNGDSSQLTITPTSPLAYAAATSLASGAPRTYTVTVAATARDVAGNRMTAAFSSSFSTLRRITQSVAPSAVATGSSYGWAAFDDPPVLCPTGTGNVSVGNHSSIAAGGSYYTWVAFDLTSVGQTSQITTFETAKFLATQVAPVGSFYPDGSVSLMRNVYAPIEEGFEHTADLNHGVFSTSSTAAVSKDITSNYWSRWVNGGSQQMFELSETGDPPSNTRAVFTCTGFSLELVFLAP
jgi:Bacterial Ig-like domain